MKRYKYLPSSMNCTNNKRCQVSVLPLSWLLTGPSRGNFSSTLSNFTGAMLVGARVHLQVLPVAQWHHLFSTFWEGFPFKVIQPIKNRMPFCSHGNPLGIFRYFKGPWEKSTGRMRFRGDRQRPPSWRPAKAMGSSCPET